MLHIKTWNSRLCIFGFEELENDEIIKQSVANLPLIQGTEYFIGSGRTFFVIQPNKDIFVYRMRENWNGYHDSFKLIKTETGYVEDFGVISARPEIGQHRDVFRNA